MLEIQRAVKIDSVLTGRTVTQIKKKLALLLYPKSSKASRVVLMSRLWTGKTLNPPTSFTKIICIELDCTPNELYNYKSWS